MSLVLNAEEIASYIAAAIQSGISTTAAPVLYDSITRNRSTVVACTGANQTIFPANTARRGLIFQNRSSTEIIRIEFGGDVDDEESLEIDPKGGYFMEAHERDLRSFNVKGASGAQFRAIEIVAI